MTADRDDGPTGTPGGPSRRSWPDPWPNLWPGPRPGPRPGRWRRPRPGEQVGAGLLAGALFLAAVGWFLLSLLVAHNDVRTAIRETVGVGLGLMILISMIGAVRNGARTNRGDE